jgi:phosphatidylglycerophosphatase C
VVARIGADALARTLDQILEQAGAASRVVAAFDADGTLWSLDVGETLFKSALDARLIHDEAGDAMREIAQRHGIANDGSACELAARLFRAYQEGLMPERDCAEMQVRCYAGWSRTELTGLACEVLSEAHVTPHHFPPTLAMLSWARTRGVRCIVVSASPAAAVEIAARSCGFAAQDVFAARTGLADGHWTAALDGPLPWGEQKAVLARAAAGDGLWLASFGDGEFDFELLQRARVAVAVRPSHGLRAHFDQIRTPLYELVAAPGTV